MADRILKPDSGNDLVLQNDDGSGKIEINENASIPVTGTLDVSGATLTTSSAQKQAIVQAGPGSGTLDVSSGTFTTSSAQKQAIVDGASNFDVSGGTFTTSSAQKQAIVQAGPGSGTLDVSSGTLTTSTAQKDAIVDGSTAISRSGNNLTFAGTVGNTGDNTITSGNLVIGTAGKGIDFSNQTHSTAYTPSSELLDHYEEGTWTPVIKADPGSSANTLSGFTGGTGSSTADYTRIGDICHLRFAYDNRTISGTNSGRIIIEGIPFAGVGQYAFSSYYLNYGGTKFSQENVVGFIVGGESRIQLVYQPGNSNWGDATFSGIGSGSYGGLSITYYVA